MIDLRKIALWPVGGKAPAPVLQAKNVTPTAAGFNVVPDEGFDGLSAVEVNGDEFLIPKNVKKDVTIFGVTGTLAPGPEPEPYPAPPVPEYTDGKTRLWVTIPENPSNMVLALFQQTARTVEINWGDGSESEIPSSQDVNIQHTYAPGNYIISIENLRPSNTNLKLGNSRYAYRIYGSSNNTCKLYITRAEILCGLVSQQCFYDCRNLKKVYLYDGLNVDTESFYNCGIRSVYLRGTATSRSFSGCKKLTTVIYGAGVTATGDSSFVNLPALNKVMLPSGLLSIGSAFVSECKALSSLEIPDTVVSIGSSAFYRTAIAKLVIPEGIVTIGDTILAEDTALTEVVIPSTATSISGSAVSNCPGLSKVVVLAETPPTITENTFYYANAAEFYVPASAVDTYKAATNWIAYADRIFAIPENE